MLQYDLTPDIKGMLSSSSFAAAGALLLPLNVLRPRFADKAPYAALYTRAEADRLGVECGMTASWIAWYEYYYSVLPRVVSGNDITTMIIGGDFTPLMCCNHYMKTRNHKTAWWWRCGVLHRTTARLKIRYTGHIIRPPREYTLEGRLAQVFNRTSSMKPNVVILDCDRIGYRAAVISSLQHLGPGASVIAKLPASQLWEQEAPSVIYTMRQLFASSYMQYSQADGSVCIAHIGLVKKIPPGMYKAMAGVRGPSMYDTPPPVWDVYVASYNAMLTRIAAADSAELPGDFADIWHGRHELIPIDTRLHLVDDEERALMEL